MIDNASYTVKNDDLAPDLEMNDKIIFQPNGRYQIIKNFGEHPNIY